MAYTFNTRGGDRGYWKRGYLTTSGYSTLLNYIKICEWNEVEPNRIAPLICLEFNMKLSEFPNKLLYGAKNRIDKATKKWLLSVPVVHFDDLEDY